ncbi:uncharacterized protein LOC135472584 [Liolophura sinensis]|uniref:uncharacterized protein LOC135472584 n=1 Tax=Liolophura sinensis TaxID=3198878 RepID=UPI003159848D
MNCNNARPIRQTYSVYVGHLSFEVTKNDLRDLFEDCGDITEVFIASQSKEMCFTYGFVSFKNLEAAKRAQADLHRWELKGNKITVEMSKKSIDDVKAKRKAQLVREQYTERSVSRGPDVKENTDHAEGLKNFGRLKEAFRNLELEAESGKESHFLDLDKVMKDVSEETNSRLPTRTSKVFGLDTSVETAREQLLGCKCSKACSKDKRTDEFMESLQLIINNIDAFLKKSCRNSASTSDSALKENRFQAGSDSHADEREAVISSPALSSVTVANRRTETVNFEKSPFSGARPKEKVVSSSEEESGSCGEDLSSSLNSSSDASVSQGENLSSMEAFVQTVLGRGRGRKIASKLQSPKSPGVSAFQKSPPSGCFPRGSKTPSSVS